MVFELGEKVKIKISQYLRTGSFHGECLEIWYASCLRVCSGWRLQSYKGTK